MGAISILYNIFVWIVAVSVHFHKLYRWQVGYVLWVEGGDSKPFQWWISAICHTMTTILPAQYTNVFHTINIPSITRSCTILRIYTQHADKSEPGDSLQSPSVLSFLWHLVSSNLSMLLRIQLLLKYNIRVLMYMRFASHHVLNAECGLICFWVGRRPSG